jgi:hypothetical protein
MGMPILPTRPIWYVVPKCGLQKPEQSIAPCGKHMELGYCSVEEIGSLDRQARSGPESKKPAQPVNGNGNLGGHTIRDRLCQLIRQHQLDATMVKSYATDFCGVKALRDATREQVEKFVAHLAEQAEKDRSALVCQLNSYGNPKAGAA